jgi:hypothetical protein
MWLKDELNNPGHPGQYNNGVTGITCYFDVVVESGKPTFDVDVRLENDGAGSNYEYWTNIGFTPGSNIGNTYSPSNSEMIVPIDYYQVAWNQGNWMQSADITVQNSPHVNEYNNLALLSNWEHMGIAYAWPSLVENYFGVINHDEGEGLFRITDSPQETPGFKFWTWGDENGMNADPYDFNDEARPMIELWAGVSHEFFEDAFLPANAQLAWKETYMTTMGMPGVSFINDKLAFHQEADPGNMMSIHAFLPVLSGQEEYTLEYEIRNGLGQSAWTDEEMLADDLINSHASMYDLESLGLPGGAYTWTTNVVMDGSEVVHSEVTGFELLSTSVFDIDQTGGSLVLSNPHTGRLDIVPGNTLGHDVRLQVFDVQGRQVFDIGRMTEPIHLTGLTPGIYFVQALHGKEVYTDRIVIQ